jgi:TonB-dependent starch-binding outer membrane protein SusC
MKFRMRKFKQVLSQGIPRPIWLALCFSACCQLLNAQVRGVVSTESGPAAGVTVVVKGSSNGTSTDIEGRYELRDVARDAILVFSYTGYDTQEVPVNNRTTVDVMLEIGENSLDQIVVVGYGTQKKSSLTGAISQVSSREISAVPVIDTRQALQGRVAGILVVNNGSPGEEPIVRIRGIGSINFASNPLYVVDGLPTGDLSIIDTRDVESVEVLKDAAAATIYGSRAANGVIMITTKKATRNGRINVNLDAYVGTEQAWRQLDLLDREGYIKYATALRTNAGQALPARFAKLNEETYRGSGQTYAQTDTDWQDEMFQSGLITQQNLSVSSGNEKSRFYASGGFFKQEGIMIGTGYERYNLRLNHDHNIGKRVVFGHQMSLGTDYKLNENNGGGRTQLKHILHMTPYIPVEDPTLPGGYRGPSGDDGSDPQNPVRLALQDLNRNRRFRILSTAFVEAKIFESLKYRFTAGVDYVTGTNRINNPIYNESFNARALNRVEQNRFNFVSPYLSNQLTFDKTFGKHYFNITAVAERQDGRYNTLSGGGNYPTNELTQVSNTLLDPGINGRTETSVLFSYLGRLNYEFANKYLLSASFRRDGSSVFAPGNKWGNFPSVSAGWRISEENFMKGISQISELKIRGSYGLMGFNGIQNYAWQPVLSQNTAAVFGADARQQGTYFDFLGNTELAWEITTMTNIGLDLGLFNNRVNFQAEYFDRQTDDLILNQPLSPSLGFSQSTPANVGSMQNRGMEFQLGYRTKSTSDFRWDVTANIGFVRNKVLSFGENITGPLFTGESADYGGDPITRTAPGSSVQGFFGWRVDGIFQNQGEIDRLNAIDGNDKTPYQSSATKPGDIRFADINGLDDKGKLTGQPDGKVDASDRVELGSFLPTFSYGANFNASFRNFDLTIFLQGVQGNEVYNGTKVLRQGMLRLFNAGTEVLNAWTPTNTNTDVPRAVDGDPNRNSRTSDRFIEDGSYLRIKNLTLGYTFPSSVLGRSFSRFRIYGSAQNLLTFTKYTGYDPEIGSRFSGTLTNGVDYGQFPSARTLLLGVQVGF